MNSQSQQAKDIFVELIGNVPPEEWEDRLVEASGGDQELLIRVRALLRAHAEPGSFLEEPAVANQPDPTIDQPITEKPGTQIGPYKLLQQIGEGGMGVVYMAEQKQPMKRRVALKIIKPGMDTRQVIARFEAERQALAMMDHPNIAKVLDAGQTESGRPYFVMELVNGISVTKYCDQQHLTPKERLQLFVHICQAVQHAHQKGIIHRDLKPSNVLVALYDGKAVPKVIDFGVAKATNQSLTDKTMFTQLGQIVGTLEYMSPEQAQRNQLDVDTRSDIYSLGVILYELLSGETPFDSKKLRSAALEEMLRIICEDEPSKPSTKVSSSDALPSIAANRRIAPQKLGATIRGELDWIVMKALEKDRSRRYETANKFAEDVENFLNDEAVEACPPSRRYRLKKFIRRNKGSMLTMAAIGAALILGMIGTTWQFFHARIERDRAMNAETIASERLDIVERQKNDLESERERVLSEARRADEEAGKATREAAIAHAIDDFLRNDLLNMVSAEKLIQAGMTPDPNVTVRAVLENAARKLEGRFANEPLVEAGIRQTIGFAYFSLGKYEQAILQGRKAYEMQQKELGPAHRETLKSQVNLAGSLLMNGQLREGISISERVVNLLVEELGPDHRITWNAMQNHAFALNEVGQSAASITLMEKILESQKRVLEPDDPLTFHAKAQLGAAFLGAGKYSQATRLLKAAYEQSKLVLGEKHPATMRLMKQLTEAYSKSGEGQKSLDLASQYSELSKQVFGSNHPTTLIATGHLANAYLEAGDYAKSIRLYTDALEMSKKALGIQHPDTALRMSGLGVALAKVAAKSAEYEESIALLTQAHELLDNHVGSEHPDTLKALIFLGEVHSMVGNYPTAISLINQSVSGLKKTLGEEHPDTLQSMNQLGRVYTELGEPQKGIDILRQTLDAQLRVLGTDHSGTLDTMNNLGSAYFRLGRFREALEMFRRSYEGYKQALGTNHHLTWGAAANLGIAYADSGQPVEGIHLLKECLARRPEGIPPSDPRVLTLMNNLALVYLEVGERENWTRLLEDAYQRSRTLSCSVPIKRIIITELIAAYLAIGQPTKGLELIDAESGAMQEVLGPHHPEVQNLKRLEAGLYFESGSVEKSIRLFKSQTEENGSESSSNARIGAFCRVALISLSQGRPSDFREACRATLRIAELPDSELAGLNVAWTCTFLPDTVDDWSPIVALAERAVELHPESQNAQITLGAVLVRAGETDRAVETLVVEAKRHELGTEKPQLLGIVAYARFWLAMGYQQQGDRTRALDEFNRVSAWTQEALKPRDPGDGTRVAWHRRLTLRILEQQAAQILGLPPPEARAPANQIDQSTPIGK